MANTQINIKTNGTTTLATAGKYCDRNIDVNVAIETGANDFTNVLTHESTTVVLNKYAGASSETAFNGEIVVYIDLVALGFNTHPAELTIRWRGMEMSNNYQALFLSTDKTTWTATSQLYNATLDEHGDFSLYKKINYPTSNRYLKASFRVKGNKIAVTQDDVDKCILTINESIGNTIEGITPTGTVNITTNGTHDVTNYASANVNIPASGITPTGIMNITENGDYDVTEYAGVNVAIGGKKYTNVLFHESVTRTLNSGAMAGGISTRNGSVVVDLDLVALGFNTHPAELTFRWRGLFVDGTYQTMLLSTDKTTWSGTLNLNTCTIDENGDFSIYKKINYPTSNRYLRFTFARKHSTAITETDIANCILTINEPIG